MNLQDIISKNAFFAPETGRTVEDVTVTEFMVNVKYREENAEVPSSLIALRAPFRTEAAKKPAYVMSISLGCVVKRNIDTDSYTVKVAAIGQNAEEVNLEYSKEVSEEEFFQQSLLSDFRTLTYDHIRMVDDMVQVIADFEEANATNA